jgi:hypothetical protein
LAVAALFLLASSTGCTDATGEIIGGQPLFVEGDDASDDAGPSECLDAGDRGSGSTFTDLYRDFFGPTGLASCTAMSACHISPMGRGYKNTHYTCSPDQSTCWMTMTTSIVPSGGSATPETTTMYRALRKAPPIPHSGPMPLGSTFAFCPSDLQRIAEWIADGAQNN